MEGDEGYLGPGTEAEGHVAAGAGRSDVVRPASAERDGRAAEHQIGDILLHGRSPAPRLGFWAL